jgi:membrane protein YfhO
MVKLGGVLRAHPDAASVLTLTLLPFLMLGRALVPGKVLSAADILLLSQPWKSLAPGLQPVNDLLSDVTILFQPWLIYAAAEIGQGRIPLWNPHVFAGSPFFANPQSALLFPLTWIALILPTAPAFALIAILKVAASGVAMYTFLRVRALHPLAALMGATSFMWSGLLVVWLQWSYASTLMFFPLLFAAVEHLRTRDGSRPMALLALAVALDVFAGYPQGLLLGLLSASAWALYRARGAGARFLVRCAAGGALGLVLASIQLLPFIEYARHSKVLSYRTEWLLPLHASFRSAVNLLMPYYYGSPTGRDYWGEWNFNELSASVGLAPWVLLPVALLARHRAASFFGLLSFVAGALLYGAGTSWVNTGFFVITFRLASPLVFALCVLGALGMDALLTEPRRLHAWLPTAVKIGFSALVALAFLSLTADYGTMVRAGLKVWGSLRYLWFLVLLTASAALTLTGIRRGGSQWALALIAIQLGGLAPLAMSYNPVIDARLLYPTPPAVARLQQEATRAPGRVLMAANMPMLYGLYGVAGYDGMTPRHIDEVIRSTASTLSVLGSGHLAEVPIFFSPVRDLLGIRHILVPPDLTLNEPGLSLQYQAGDARIYRNEAALPRAFVVPRARCLDEGQALRLIQQRAVDFRNEVILTGCTAAPRIGGDTFTATVVIEHYAPQRVVITATSDRGGYLVLTDTWFPGWSARVDGQDAQVERADYAFRAVRVESGRHEVQFRYRPGSVRLGLILSGLAALTTVALCWRSRRRKPVEGS